MIPNLAPVSCKRTNLSSISVWRRSSVPFTILYNCFLLELLRCIRNLLDFLASSATNVYFVSSVLRSVPLSFFAEKKKHTVMVVLLPLQSFNAIRFQLTRWNKPYFYCVVLFISHNANTLYTSHSYCYSYIEIDMTYIPTNYLYTPKIIPTSLRAAVLPLRTVACFGHAVQARLTTIL